MQTLEKMHELKVPNEHEVTHEKTPASAWMAAERETIGDILIKNATMNSGELPIDVAAMAAANYRSALAWRDFGDQLTPSTSFEPIAQMNWQYGNSTPSPQLIDGVTAASEYIALAAPPEISQSFPQPTANDDFNSITDGLEALLGLIFGSFMPWLAP